MGITTLVLNIFYLGLIREGEGVAARVLENLALDLSKVRTQVIRLLGDTAEVSSGSGQTKVKHLL